MSKIRTGKYVQGSVSYMRGKSNKDNSSIEIISQYVFHLIDCSDHKSDIVFDCCNDKFILLYQLST